MTPPNVVSIPTVEKNSDCQRVWLSSLWAVAKWSHRHSLLVHMQIQAEK